MAIVRPDLEGERADAGALTRHKPRSDTITPFGPADTCGSPKPGFRLAKAHDTVGGYAGGHRSGWPYVLSRLSAEQSENGILLDDFVESTFGKRQLPLYKRLLGSPPLTLHTWNEPWIGMFHLPPHFPEWFNPNGHPDAIFSNRRFLKSLPHLKGIVTLSNYAGEWLQARFGLPTLALKHPTELVAKKFSWEAFEASDEKRLVQIGWYIRNYRAIYQASVPPWVNKVHLAQDKPFIAKAQRRTDRHSPYRNRVEHGSVQVVSWLENEAYDDLLSSCVMFLELFDASANNAIIEAIARNTPVVVNRHSAVQEYLGDDYPLYFDTIDDVEKLMDLSLIRAAHDHISALDKSEYSIDRFVERINNFVATVV